MGTLQSLATSLEVKDEIMQHIQPLSMIIVSDAGCCDANGVYALISEEMGGRPVWANLGKPTYRIQWLDNVRLWVLQLVDQDPLYCIWDRDEYTFPSDPRWSHWKPSASNGPLPSISYQPLANVVVHGAGTSDVNGVYIPCPLTEGGRPVWALVGNDDTKILWDKNLGTWLLDCNGQPIYRMDNCREKSFPRAASWTAAVVGETPTPKCHCTLRSNIVVKGAGTPGVDGLYVPCRDAHGGRPVWTLLGSDDYRIRWSKSFNVWIIEYHERTALYRIDDCSDCTPPMNAKWECFQGGAKPTPSTEYQAFCNIILSEARIAKVNGVYSPIDEAVGGLPVWQKLGTRQFRIQWSLDAAMWVLKDVTGVILYSCKDIQYLRTDDPGVLPSQKADWLRYNTSDLADRVEEEEDDGLGSCLGRSSNTNGYAKKKPTGGVEDKSKVAKLRKMLANPPVNAELQNNKEKDMQQEDASRKIDVETVPQQDMAACHEDQCGKDRESPPPLLSIKEVAATYALGQYVEVLRPSGEWELAQVTGDLTTAMASKPEHFLEIMYASGDGRKQIHRSKLAEYVRRPQVVSPQEDTARNATPAKMLITRLDELEQEKNSEKDMHHDVGEGTDSDFTYPDQILGGHKMEHIPDFEMAGCSQDHSRKHLESASPLDAAPCATMTSLGTDSKTFGSLTEPNGSCINEDPRRKHNIPLLRMPAPEKQNPAFMTAMDSSHVGSDTSASNPMSPNYADLRPTSAERVKVLHAKVLTQKNVLLSGTTTSKHMTPMTPKPMDLHTACADITKLQVVNEGAASPNANTPIREIKTFLQAKALSQKGISHSDQTKQAVSSPMTFKQAGTLPANTANSYITTSSPVQPLIVPPKVASFGTTVAQTEPQDCRTIAEPVNGNSKKINRIGTNSDPPKQLQKSFSSITVGSAKCVMTLQDKATSLSRTSSLVMKHSESMGGSMRESRRTLPASTAHVGVALGATAGLNRSSSLKMLPATGSLRISSGMQSPPIPTRSPSPSAAGWRSPMLQTSAASFVASAAVSRPSGKNALPSAPAALNISATSVHRYTRAYGPS